MSGRMLRYRRKGIVWEYNFDGVFSDEVMSKSDKDYWRKWRRRMWNKEDDEIIKQMQEVYNV